MAYGKIYTIDIAQTFLNKAVSCEIYKDGYSGSSTTLTGSGDPLRLQFLSSERDNPYAPIHGSNLTIEVMSKTVDAYIDFAKFLEREYLAILKVDTSEIWRGFLLPGEYSQMHCNYPYHFKLKASDGLGLLKNIDYKREIRYRRKVRGSCKWYYGKTTLMIILYRVLQYTWHNLQLRENFNVYEENMDSTPYDTPLNQAYLDDIFAWNDGDYLNCYEVLEGILKGLNARIYQWGGYWYIERIPELTAGYYRRTYNAGFTYMNTVFIYNKHISKPIVSHTAANVARASLNRFWTGVFREYKDAAREVNITHDRGKIDNLVNSQWTKYTWLEDNELPDGWEIGLQDSSYTDDGLRIRSAAPAYQNTSADFSLGDLALERFRQIDVYTLELRGDIYFPKVTGENLIGGTFLIEFIRVYSSGGVMYFDPDEKYWTTTRTAAYAFSKSNDDSPVGTELGESFNETIGITRTIKTTDTEPSGTKDYRVRLFQLTCTSVVGYKHVNIPDDGIKLTQTINRMTDSGEYSVINTTNNNKIYSLDAMFGDSIPALPSREGYTVNYNISELPYRNILLYKSGDDYFTTKRWARRGRTEGKEILEIILNELAEYYSKPNYKLRGILMAHLEFGKLFEMNNIYYIIDEATYSLKHDTWDVNLIELYRSEDYILLEDGDIMDTETPEHIEKE